MNKVNICANESIQAKEFLLIDENGIPLGQVSRKQAFEIAVEKDLDLVQVSISPAVVKLLKLGKYTYQMSKIQKERKRKQTVIETKTIVLRLKTGFDAKEVIKKKAKKFFYEGNKVIFNMKLRKKERSQIENGILIMQQLKEDLSKLSTVVKDIQTVGENVAISMTLAGKKTQDE